MRRLAGRYICRVCQMPYHQAFSPPKQEGKCDEDDGELYQRDDDKAEVVKNRLKVYFDETAPAGRTLSQFRRAARGKWRRRGGRSGEPACGCAEELTEELTSTDRM